MPKLSDISRLPAPQDNCAIAIRDLPQGTPVTADDREYALSHSVLEGHRFAVSKISPGETLTSWGQRFGVATRPIKPGDYVINDGVRVELGRRQLDFDLPEANFENQIQAYAFDDSTFVPAQPLPRYDEMRYFEGYARGGGRGVGTRNMIVILGTSSHVAGFTRTATQMMDGMADAFEHVDGIVPVAHTEGGHRDPNNRELLLRTLAGFVAHPNVGAVLALDYGSEPVNNADLREYMLQNDYPLEHVTHEFYSLGRSFEDNVACIKDLLSRWLPVVNQTQRSPQPLSQLKIALQCGGSDAFSGISGNPLAAWVAKEVIRYGGCANLAETDELIGSEAYVLEKVERVESARQFLDKVERFKQWAGWHGQTAEGNPSGGNKYRGLYNIYLKSLGAAAKRHPDVPLHDVIDYSQRMTSGGFYFMDSPGNDLESIAGQVASGCNMIFFVTGNGSITNFPFVPTIKFVTTTARHTLLKYDLDVNAGAYLDGDPLDELGAETLDLTVHVAAGQESLGERAGHHQVQIWRDWQQTRQANVSLLKAREYDGMPLAIDSDMSAPDASLPVYEINGEFTAEQVGLVLPTSLCSGQIARLTTDTLNARGLAEAAGLSRFVTLVHTEGCGGTVVPEFKDTLIGYLRHPRNRHTLLLEHGCEITHNSYFRALMLERGLNPNDYGFASIQLDGGIDAVMRKIVAWFAERTAADAVPQRQMAGVEAIRLGLLTQSDISDEAARSLAQLCRMIVGGGGTVVVAENDPLIGGAFTQRLGLADAPAASLGYGQKATRNGFHVMARPRAHWSETLTGFGATGVELMLGGVDGYAMAGHPLLPTLQVAFGVDGNADLDAALSSSADSSSALFDLVVDTMRGEHQPRHERSGAHDFQVTRGLAGVSF